MEPAVAMVTERPYVVVFLALFVAVSGAERGWKRTLFWALSGSFLGWLAEVSSIRNGFPFGDYSYHEELFPRELWLGGVPFFGEVGLTPRTEMTVSERTNPDGEQKYRLFWIAEVRVGATYTFSSDEE